MNDEPKELSAARRCLSKAEAGYRSSEGLAALAEGVELLDDLIGAGDPPHAQTARNLAVTYAARLYEEVARTLDADPALPEPDLEQLFRVVLAFDRVAAALPPAARQLKIEVVRRLIDRYYEGHPPESKQRALGMLHGIEREH